MTALAIAAQGISGARGAPEADSDDPLHLIISLPKQQITIYKGGQPVASSRVSTGKAGHRTPPGIFSILEKRRKHRSNIYRGAPMPFMQRITWSGLALHAGRVPNYPASHGCIRLPHSFAKKVFSMNTRGAHVIIGADNDAPQEVSHAKLFQPFPVPHVLSAMNSSDHASPDGAIRFRTIEEKDLPATGQKTFEINVVQPVRMSARDAALEVLDSEAELMRIRAWEARSPAPLRILLTRRTGREQLRDVQEILTSLGYDTQGIDGYMGRDTASAIKLFQKAHDLPANGMVSPELIQSLYKVSGRGEPATGHLYVRQNHVDIYDTPVVIREPDRPLGVHLFTVMNFADDATEARWLAVSPERPARSRQQKRRGKRRVASIAKATPVAGGTTVDPEDALDRIEIPAAARQRISELLTPGSSFAISDHGISRETGKGTDFVVLIP